MVEPDVNNTDEEIVVTLYWFAVIVLNCTLSVVFNDCPTLLANEELKADAEANAPAADAELVVMLPILVFIVV